MHEKVTCPKPLKSISHEFLARGALDLQQAEFWNNQTFTKFAKREKFVQVEKNLIQLVNEYISCNMDVIDVCCGNGEYTKLISKKCRTIIGYDISESLLQIANSEFPLTNGRYVKMNLDKEILLPHSLDVIFFMGSLSSIIKDETVDTLIGSFYNSLKYNGILLTRDSLTYNKRIEKMHKRGNFAVYRNAYRHIDMVISKGFSLEKILTNWAGKATFNKFYVYRKRRPLEKHLSGGSIRSWLYSVFRA